MRRTTVSLAAAYRIREAAASEANQTSLCAWLSAGAAGGQATNAALGWWWADPAAGLAIAAMAGIEGVHTWRAESLADTC
jgi:divalent metal cation (Fe/Co/Zn/Cd) transporter